MAQVPPISRNAIELLTNKHVVEEPFINKFWGPALMGSVMFLGACISNWHIRRPMLSGIQKHVIMTASGIFIGKLFQTYQAEYNAERDAVLRHYIQLHPEDFPDFEHKKYSELFEPWIPIR